MTMEYAPSDGTQIHYEDLGTGHAVLLLHAGIADHTMWDPQVPALLEAGFRVIRCDLRGFGGTEMGEADFAFRWDLVNLLSHVGVQNAHVVGCSIGGGAALDLVAERPDLVTSLTLIGSSVRNADDDDEETDRDMEAIEALADAGDHAAAAEREAVLWLVGRGRPVTDVDPALLDRVRTWVVPTYGVTGWQRSQQPDLEGLDYLKAITAPTLVVVGKHDLTTIHQATAVLAENIPQSRVVVIDGAAHLPSLERPERFNDVLLGFLKDVWVVAEAAPYGYGMRELPMFPLGMALVPHAILPLHIFEERYRAMTRHCLDGDREFGVVLIERGSEVGGGETRAGVGTLARIVESEELDDGRWVLISVGTHRIRVHKWLADAPYPRALVDDLPDHPIGAGPDLGDPLQRTVRRVAGLLTELGEQAPPITITLDVDPLVAAWQAAAVLPIGPLDLQRILEVENPLQRIQSIATAITDVEELLRLRLAT